MAHQLHFTCNARIHGNVVTLINAPDDIGDVSLDTLRCDAIDLVEDFLFGSATVSLVDSVIQACCHLISIQDDPTVHISSCTADGLNETGLRTQEPLLVRIQDSD